MSCISMDTILFLDTIVHFYSRKRYKVMHMGRKRLKSTDRDGEWITFISLYIVVMQPCVS